MVSFVTVRKRVRRNEYCAVIGYPSGSHPGLPAVFRKKHFPESHMIMKSFIDQAWSVKIAGYWPRSKLVNIQSS